MQRHDTHTYANRCIAHEMAKRNIPTDSAPTSSTAKHQSSGVDLRWRSDFPWLEVNHAGDGMFCSLCRKHSRRPKKVVIG